MPSVDVARGCSESSGKFFAVIITIIALISFFVHVASSGFSIGSTVFLLCVLLFAWLALPRMLGWFGSYKWKSDQAVMEGYMRQGLSKTDALAKMQELQLAKQQAAAIRSLRTQPSVQQPGITFKLF